MAKKKKEKLVRVTQIKSLIGQKNDQKRTVEALGLKRIRHTVTKTDTPQIRGMLHKVRHLVTVEEID